MFNNLLGSFFLLFPIIIGAQDCGLHLHGNIKDLHTGVPLDLVYIYIKETGTGSSTDNSGEFVITNLCPGEYHVVLSHIGCESKQIFIDFKADSVVQWTMEHAVHLLSEVTVVESAISKTTQNTSSFTEQQILDNSDESLSELITRIPGVSSLKNGSGISKPIIHGLYGNRITILNNGVSQSGQQWGNDHSPEIDALTAQNIRVIKGSSSLEYMGSNLGGIVLVEPGKINREPHVHGRVNYNFESNGRGHRANIQLQKYGKALAWRINSSFNRAGDKSTPNYFLNNSGNKEINFALQLEKVINDRWFLDGYFSSFNTNIGILRGSHIGNLMDLDDALKRDIPFYTEDQFSYAIDAPKQEVHHHLAKLNTRYYFDESQWINFLFASQLNDRNEFDVRRSGRTEIPALSMAQWSHFLEGRFEKEMFNLYRFKTGLQLNITDNTNNPETGILPLIPDYLSYQTGLYTIFNHQIKSWNYEMGIRYDNIFQDVATISNSTPREIIRYTNIFHNFSTSAGLTYTFSSGVNVTYNIGLASRNPAINELYSFGLHQGVSGIEEGDPNLKSERSFKNLIDMSFLMNDFLSIGLLAYHQNIRNYIYLQPQNETRLTIRGAFPVFRYEQTNAQLSGFDLTGSIHLDENIHAEIDYSFIHAKDITNDLGLINIPSNRVRVVLAYEFNTSFKIGQSLAENTRIEVNDLYVFKQKLIAPEQDFVLPPDDYNLIGIKAATDLQVKGNRLRFVFKIDNLLNTKYRDYLNRQRYFADEPGTNVQFGINVKF